jgi:hypothetical protein
MRGVAVGVALLMAVLFPNVSNAQAYAYGTPAPEVTAGTAEWQTQSLRIIVNGLVYYPTRAFRLFDPAVMTQTGVYDGVPVYSDVTIEPYSNVYVPVSRSNMRVYERRREGALAPAGDLNGAVGTSGSSLPRPVSTSGTASIPDRVRPKATRVESVPAPVATNGVWLEFNGARWYADGAAVSFTPDRFAPIGEYRGFPVYRDREGKKPNEIWVSVVKDGPVAPYATR